MKRNALFIKTLTTPTPSPRVLKTLKKLSLLSRSVNSSYFFLSNFQSVDMSRSLQSVKMVASLVSRRRFAAVSQGVEASRKSGMTTNVVAKEEPAPWTPDPVTGCYRPENAADEIDVAELRAMLLKQSKNKKN